MAGTERIKKKLPIGISDFRMLREENRHHVGRMTLDTARERRIT